MNEDITIYSSLSLLNDWIVRNKLHIYIYIEREFDEVLVIYVHELGRCLWRETADKPTNESFVISGIINGILIRRKLLELAKN